MISKFVTPGLILGAMSAGVVLYLGVADIGRTSPGTLSAVHGNVEELQGRSGCAECHGGWATSMTQSCLDCHAPIQTQMELGSGLHGRLDAELGQACASCHSDHHGAGFTPVNKQSFRLAGVPDIEEFDHALVGFAMEGVHLEQTCTDCHANAEVEVLPAGQHRFLGLSSDCSTCHDDPHDGAMKVSCVQCHGQTAWDALESRDHDRFLRLVGGHEPLDCRQCHEDTGRHSLDIVGTARMTAVPGRARACADCHDSPHAERFESGVAALFESTTDAGCVQCHTETHESFREPELAELLSPEEHAFSGFRLELPHAESTCAECHDPDEHRFRDRYPGRRWNDCAACHDDPHDAQFDGSAHAPDGCLSCHDEHQFETHRFDVERHAQTSLALEDAHAGVDCYECHEVHRKRATVFHGTPDRCDQCHRDAHAGFFDAVSREERRVEGGECARCHRATTFSEWNEQAFDHDHWAAFELRGAHAQSDCESCHPRSEERDEFGRSFGRVDEHFGEFEGCANCHGDPHRGYFDGPGQPRMVDEREGCARCHTQTSFRVIGDEFDHALWTGFPLRGQHRKIDCSECHTPRVNADEFGRTWEAAPGTSCSDCHTNPHAGQFQAEGATDCRRCHQSARTFSLLVFDHDTDSRFPLDEAHEKVACAACHKPWPMASGGEVVRYRPLEQECVDCHGVHEDVLRARARGKKD